MELQQIVDRIRAIRSEMSAIETRINNDTDFSLTLEEIKSLEDEWDTLDAELAMYEGMLDVWVEPEFEEPPAPEEEEEKEEEEIDYANPPDWLVKKWDEERDSWTNWNLYGSEAFDLADEV